MGDHAVYQGELVIIRAIRKSGNVSIRFSNRSTRWVPLADLREVGDDDIEAVLPPDPA